MRYNPAKKLEVGSHDAVGSLSRNGGTLRALLCRDVFGRGVLENRVAQPVTILEGGQAMELLVNQNQFDRVEAGGQLGQDRRQEGRFAPPG